MNRTGCVVALLVCLAGCVQTPEPEQLLREGKLFEASKALDGVEDGARRKRVRRALFEASLARLNPRLSIHVLTPEEVRALLGFEVKDFVSERWILAHVSVEVDSPMRVRFDYDYDNPHGRELLMVRKRSFAGFEIDPKWSTTLLGVDVQKSELRAQSGAGTTLFGFLPDSVKRFARREGMAPDPKFEMVKNPDYDKDENAKLPTYADVDAARKRLSELINGEPHGLPVTAVGGFFAMRKLRKHPSDRISLGLKVRYTQSGETEALGGGAVAVPVPAEGETHAARINSVFANGPVPLTPATSTR